MEKFDEMFPVAQNFHTGLFGWRRVNGGFDLSACRFKSKSAAARDRNQSHEKALFEKTGELALSR